MTLTDRTLAQVAAAADYAQRDVGNCRARIEQHLAGLSAEADRLLASLSIDRGLVETVALWNHVRAIEGELASLDHLTDSHRRLDRLRDLIQRPAPGGPSVARGSDDSGT